MLLLETIELHFVLFLKNVPNQNVPNERYILMNAIIVNYNYFEKRSKEYTPFNPGNSTGNQITDTGSVFLDLSRPKRRRKDSDSFSLVSDAHDVNAKYRPFLKRVRIFIRIFIV